jgi:hypothetical protein
MKARQKALKTMKTIRTRRRHSLMVRLLKTSRRPKEPTLLQKITQMTEELQSLRSRLSNAGSDLPAVGTHRITALEMELERLWEQRRQERAAPLREAALSDQDIEVLAFPGANRSRGT